mgnify:CR=1
MVLMRCELNNYAYSTAALHIAKDELSNVVKLHNCKLDDVVTKY